jgi:hypothetical protein
MTKAMMTAQPGGTSAALNMRQQATEADTVDERWKQTKPTGVNSDHSPFSPRRSIPKSLDRNNRRAHPTSVATGTLTNNNTDKDLSLSKKLQQTSRTPPVSATVDSPKESWKVTGPSDLSSRVRRSNVSRSSAGDPATPVGKVVNKEDSPASASHSDSAKLRNGANTLSNVQNRSYPLKASDQQMPIESSILNNADETPSPALIMYTSAGSTEHGKPPKTPRITRTVNSRSDAFVPVRQVTTRGGDSEAMSIPAATYAIKVGPHTVMSQWIVSLDDNLDDEGSDNQHSAKWEDGHEKIHR